MRYTEHDKVCIPVPLYHCFGMVIGNLACITHGAAMVFPGEGFDPLATLQTVAEERCTSLYGVPTMFIAELRASGFRQVRPDEPAHRHDGRRAVSDRGDAAAASATMHLTEMTIGYGMTETSPVSTQTAIDDPIERRVATVGRVHPHVEVKIVDAEGRIVPRGTPGEFCTRGYSVMLGYWDDAGAHGGGDRRAPAGCTPAIWRRWTTRAIATSSAASRTW